MTDNYIRILEELEHYGTSKKADLSPLFKELYPRPSDDSDYTVKTAISPYLHLIDEMSRNKHINYDDSQNQTIGIRLNNGQHWFERPVMLSITAEGVEHLHRRHATQYSIEANKSSIETNQSVINTNKSVSKTNAAIRDNLSLQGRLFYVTLMVAILGVASQIYSAYHDFRDSEKESQIKKLEKNIEDQQKQIKELKHKLKLLTNAKS